MKRPIPDGARVLADTAPIIYVLEDNPRFATRFRWFFDGVDEGRYECVVSTVTIAELLVGPLKAARHDLVEIYRDALTTARGYEAVPLTVEIAQRAAEVRVMHNLKLPDAIQVATALAADAKFLLTADRDFSSVQELQIIMGA